MYKVGDKVIVRGDISDGFESSTGCRFTQGMEKFLGDEVTISGVLSGFEERYKILEDPEEWTWDPEFFGEGARRLGIFRVVQYKDLWMVLDVDSGKLWENLYGTKDEALEEIKNLRE